MISKLSQKIVILITTTQKIPIIKIALLGSNAEWFYKIEFGESKI